MSVTCPHCSAPNNGGTGACKKCGRTPGTEATLARVALTRATGKPSEELRPAPNLGDDSIELGDLGSSPSAKPFADHSVFGSSILGGGSDGDAFDLSAILDPLAVPHAPVGSAAAKPSAFIPAFTFPGSDDIPTRAIGPDEMPQDLGGPSQSARPATGAVPQWRVRNERGAIYDLMTVDAVVAWLEGKPNFDNVRIARGDGAFRAVDEIAEVAARLGLRSTSGGSSGGGLSFGGGADGGLRLDTDAAPPRRSGGQRGAGARPAEKSSRPAAKAAAATPEGPEVRVFGFGFILLVLAIGTATSSVAIALIGDVEPTLEAVVPVEEAPPGPALTAALKPFERGLFTAAEQALQQAAKSESNDPRVFRYLAIALAKTGRDREARDALGDYRRLVAEAGRD